MNFTPFLKYSYTFIETGTNKGDGVRAALDAGFRKVKSVELHPGLYEQARQRFAHDPRVELFFGKSVDHLPAMLQGVEKAVIWLDAHPSGPTTAGHHALMDGDEEFNQDTIIKKELAIVLSYGNHIILIDDCQGWNELTDQYASIAQRASEEYSVYWYDEQLPGGELVKNKIMGLIV